MLAVYSFATSGVNTHYQERSAEITMKSFKGSSNKLGPLARHMGGNSLNIDSH